MTDANAAPEAEALPVELEPHVAPEPPVAPVAQRYAHVDAFGVIAGFYDQDHPAIPADAFPISDERWLEWIRSGTSVRWTGSALEPVPAPPPTEADLLARAAARRFELETGGLTVNGVRIATDRASQAMIANAYAGLQASGAPSVRFKAASGWIELTADQLKAVALAVFAHVQAAFAAEDAADAAITANPPTIMTLDQVDAAFAALAPAA